MPRAAHMKILVLPGDGIMRTRETNRKKLAETEKKDAAG